MTTEHTATPAHDTISPTPSARPRRRRLKRALGISALTVAVAAGGGYLWLKTTSDVHQTGQADCMKVTPTGTHATHQDHAAVCAVMDSLIEAWDRNDADAYGKQFTKDATYTTFVGSHYEGRKDITDSHAALFDDFLEGSKLAGTYLDVRFLTPDTAVITGRGDDYTGDKPDKLSKVQTYTLVRDADEQWRVAAFHNTQRKPVMERISFIFSPDTKPQAER
ncbi:SgcJ/EcaC family oxidoreductase [Streptomyces ficellus]|uniref:SgcJ/EcaC family oxidoreductase n=1 Tax=Streptomyces ficellus TaxID=1977088 RepID=A0A6I6FD98_9ACTN|nr:SgcJ/EcaC family oxidoreductase [Streptomyces ficellus]QGV81973.1 SgcJ/EcaC family oxidoreductase [Streptomyces ficellus]